MIFSYNDLWPPPTYVLSGVYTLFFNNMLRDNLLQSLKLTFVRVRLHQMIVCNKTTFHISWLFNSFFPFKHLRFILEVRSSEREREKKGEVQMIVQRTLLKISFGDKLNSLIKFVIWCSLWLLPTYLPRFYSKFVYLAGKIEFHIINFKKCLTYFSFK